MISPSRKAEHEGTASEERDNFSRGKSLQFLFFTPGNT